jgi:ATP-dependent helicase/nuclease subunit B
MSLERQFIGWNGNLAELTAQSILAKGKPGQGMKAIDLSAHRVIVPSQFAGRLIREQLAIQSPHGVLLPKIETPESFLNWGDRNLEIATSENCLLAWIEVLTNEDFSREHYPHLFPSIKRENQNQNFDFQSAQTFAQQLIKLRDQLGGSRIAHNFKKVAEVCKEEPERWEDLAKLEEKYLEILEKNSQRDHNEVRTSLATGDGMPEGVETVWLVALLDPQPLLLEALDRRKNKLNIQILIGADKNEAAGFDEWGRPDIEFWKKRESKWSNFKSHVHIVRNPEHGLDKLGELLNQKKPEFGTVAIVPCDREEYPAMIGDRLKSFGAESLNPLGKLHGDHSIHHTMKAMLDLLNFKTFAHLRKAVLHPTLAKNLLKSPSINFEKLNLSLDVLSSRRPPQDLDTLLNYISEIKESETSDRRENKQAKEIKGLRNTLSEIILQIKELNKLNARQLGSDLLQLSQNNSDVENPYEVEFAREVSESIEEVLANLEPESANGIKLSPTEWIKFALLISKQERFRKSFVELPINLPGWMESIWEPVPHLIVFGLTDDLIPQSNNSDPFLPSRLRKQLQLTTSENHFANAAFSLERIRRCRADGRVDVIVPRHDNEGSGLRPSRLLFLCPEKELTERVTYLFESELNTEEQPYWTIPDELRLVPSATPEQLAYAQKKISATSFKNYLENPAEFWLKNVLYLRETNHEDVELDRAGFGTLVHAVLEKFGRDKENHELEQVDKITKKLSDYLDEYFSSTFGDEPEPGLILQKETARDRLGRFAELQSQLVQEGWRIKEVEGTLPSLEINGVQVGGRYDRLDYHQASNSYRVYDYKTFDEIEAPQKRHFGKVTKINQNQNVNFHFQIEGNETAKGIPIINVWRDLQLPVYYHNLKTAPDSPIKNCELEVGYIILPANGSCFSPNLGELCDL